MTNLKPCPFCGGEANTLYRYGKHGYFVYCECQFCRSRGQTFYTNTCPEDNEWSDKAVVRAENAWNRRVKDEVN